MSSHETQQQLISSPPVAGRRRALFVVILGVLGVLIVTYTNFNDPHSQRRRVEVAHQIQEGSNNNSHHYSDQKSATTATAAAGPAPPLFVNRQLIPEIDVFLNRSSAIAPSSIVLPRGHTLPFLPRDHFQIRRVCEPYSLRDPPRDPPQTAAAAAAEAEAGMYNASGRRWPVFPMSLRCRAATSDLYAVRFSPGPAPSFTQFDLPHLSAAALAVHEKIAAFDNNGGETAAPKDSSVLVLSEHGKATPTPRMDRKDFVAAALKPLSVGDQLSLTQRQQVSDCAERERAVAKEMKTQSAVFYPFLDRRDSPAAVMWDKCLPKAVEVTERELLAPPPPPSSTNTSNRRCHLIVGALPYECGSAQLQAVLTSFLSPALTSHRHIRHHDYHLLGEEKFLKSYEAALATVVEKMSKKINKNKNKKKKKKKKQHQLEDAAKRIKFFPLPAQSSHSVVVATKNHLASLKEREGDGGETLLLLDACDTVFPTRDPFDAHEELLSVLEAERKAAAAGGGGGANETDDVGDLTRNSSVVFAASSLDGATVLEDGAMRKSLMEFLASREFLEAQRNKNESAYISKPAESPSRFHELDLALLTELRLTGLARLFPDGLPLRSLRHQIVGALSRHAMLGFLQLWASLVDCKKKDHAVSKRSYDAAAFHVAVYSAIASFGTRRKSAGVNSMFDFLVLDPSVSSMVSLRANPLPRGEKEEVLSDQVMMRWRKKRKAKSESVAEEENAAAADDDDAGGEHAEHEDLEAHFENNVFVDNAHAGQGKFPATLLNCQSVPYAVVHGLLGSGLGGEFWRVNFEV